MVCFSVVRQLGIIPCSRNYLNPKCSIAQLLAAGDCSGTLDVIDDLQQLLVSITILFHSAHSVDGMDMPHMIQDPLNLWPFCRMLLLLKAGGCNHVLL